MVSAAHVFGTWMQPGAALLLAALSRAVGRAAGLCLAEGPQGPKSASRSSQGSQEGSSVQGRDGSTAKQGRWQSPHGRTDRAKQLNPQQVWLCCAHSLHC